MSDFINQTKTYKQYWMTPYCFRPMSSRRVNSVKELNRLMERIAELEAEREELEAWLDAERAVNAAQMRDRKTLERIIAVQVDRIEELKTEVKLVNNNCDYWADKHAALVDRLSGKIELFKDRRNTATNADSKSLWHIVIHELSALLGDEE
jgi:hypothetical protein